MASVNTPLKQFLEQSEICQIIRVLLGSTNGLTDTEISATLQLKPKEVRHLLNELMTHNLCVIAENRYLMVDQLENLPLVKEVIEAYEQQLITERAKQFSVDVPARFEATNVLTSIIQHARSRIS